ncbi:DUF1249 domain-containing protein [Marinospirillum perlucidum]|uniref:DUF1249 domain-containing protein n=1 Tax=Marinospirillum perlucidum TaxID=1982602 RepID=UPI000DF329FF|nr:DUF1249 domain-containing protein [Marinospirillum perlucidum]
MPRRYVAELQRLQRDAAANYLLLQRLWQAPESGRVRYGLRHHGRDLGWFSVERREATRWTELLELCLQVETGFQGIKPAQLQVRSYHDVRLTEVVAFQKKQAREGRYDYPNEAMFHPDEKVQVNSFLSELLRFVLDKGYSLEVELSHDF